MKKIIIALLIVTVFQSTSFCQDTLAKGTVVFQDMGEKVSIGDSAWNYEGNPGDFRYYILKSTKKYPKGIWTPVGKLIPASCNCVPNNRLKLVGYYGRVYYQ